MRNVYRNSKQLSAKIVPNFSSNYPPLIGGVRRGRAEGGGGDDLLLLTAVGALLERTHHHIADAAEIAADAVATRDATVAAGRRQLR